MAFSYGKDVFVQGLSACFERGKVTSIIGPNGCGKSTTVKIIDGFLRPQQGRVFVDGID
ncbi:MAG: ATP-binding cassette domain-containing protein, partial [Eggerthellaceae bacterium]|nr:ATP-binding cassette domain-containing protein [Eggerthellaceae bacterium]